MSVIAFAVHDLRVEHIIVAGHSECGGVAVCIDQHLTERDKAQCFCKGERSNWPPRQPVDQWLQDLRNFAVSLPPRPTPTVLNVVKMNVQNQVDNLLSLETVKTGWAPPPSPDGNEPQEGPRLKGVHGWWYELDTGFVHDLNVSMYAPGWAPLTQ